jgi:hypothetical protein
MSERYNGWANYETWVVNLWMDNERGQQDYWADEARQCYEKARPRGILTQRDMAAIALADRIREEHGRAATEMLEQARYETGPLSDLLNGAMSAVNWDEIARSWVDTHCQDCEEV